MAMPPFFEGDKVSDLYLHVGLLILLLLFILVLVARVPMLRGQGQLAGGGSVLNVFYVIGSLLIAAGYMAELMLDPEAKLQDVPAGASPSGVRGLYLACLCCGAIMWTCSAGLSFAEARTGRRSGRSLRLWLMLAMLHACLRLAADVERVATSAVSIGDRSPLVRMATCVLSVALGLCALCEPDSPSEDAYAHNATFRSFSGATGLSTSLNARLLPSEGPASPQGLGSPRGAGSTERGLRNTEATASYWSRWTFSWLSGILRLGSRRALEQTDLYDLQVEDATAYNSAKLSDAWQREQQRRPGKGVFLRAFHSAYGRYFWVTGVFQVVNTALMFANPILINTLVKYLSGEVYLSPTAAMVCALSMFLANSVKSLALGMYFFRGFRLGLRSKCATGQVVFEKALSLAHEERCAFGTGAIVSFMQIDAGRLSDALPYLHLLWSGPATLIVATVMLCQFLGPSGLAGILIMVFSMPLNSFLARKMGDYTRRTMGLRDKRVKFTSELLQGVRLLKLFAWERSLLGQLGDKRTAELKQVRNNLLLGGVMGFFFTAVPIFVTLATFLMYSALGNKLTAATAFTSLSLFNIIRFPLLVVPLMIARVINLSVINTRLSNFLNAKPREAVDLDSLPPPGSGGPPLQMEGTFLSRLPAPIGVAAIELHDAAFRWPGTKLDKEEDKKKKSGASGSRDKLHTRTARALAAQDAAASEAAIAEAKPPTLSGLGVQLKSGTLTVVLGPVGSGKTSLLLGILGDMPRLRGRVVVRGEVVYCAQEPWIQNRTLKDNILFGRPFDQALYEQVLSACALGADLEQLPAGDTTEIGERGINLSGGQKARIALARACYSAGCAVSPTVLLDDPVAAVDAEVGAHLMRECVAGLLARWKCTTVLVTHHVHHALVADHVIRLAPDGTIAKQGQPSSFPDLGSSPAPSPAITRRADSEGAAAGKPKKAAKQTSGDRSGGGSGRTAPADGNGRAQSEASGKSTGKIIAAEDRERGVVAMGLWFSYAAALGYTSMAVLIGIYSLSQVFTYGSSWWLTQWAADTFPTQSHGQPWFYMAIYAAASMVAAALILVRAAVLTLASIRAARKIQAEAITAVFKAPIGFFDSTPLGRIVNRFSGDVEKVDVQISGQFMQLFLNLFSLIGTIVVLALSSAFVLGSLLPLSIIYVLCAKYYRASARELQRLESISRSPIYTAFSEALQGAPTIAAMRAAPRFAAESVARFDVNTQAAFISFGANRWLSVRLEFLSNVLLALTAVLAVVSYLAAGGSGGKASAGLAGLALSYAPGMTDTLNNMLRNFTTLETMMVAVERLFEYSKLPPEEPVDKPTRKAAPPGWPAAGGIVFAHVRMGYRPGLPDVLCDLDLAIQPAEKVGIVGRTGAGKSSILVALFRMGELRAGSITIDGIDTATLPLYELRSRLAIIPQDPVLFTGTLRMNLDPFDESTDAELWAALDACSIGAAMREAPEGLLKPIDERGCNLSMGQRQLICMARALLKRSRILVLDEATASVDLETDELIQATLRAEMADATVLTIAHRLDTIMQGDRVVVMHAGQAVESGPPAELRERPGSRFGELWSARANAQ